MRTGVAGVALVAQLPERVSASWTLQPVPESLLADGTRASVLVLESNWHFAMGRSVTCSAHLVSASEEAPSAALVLLQRTGDTITSPLAIERQAEIFPALSWNAPANSSSALDFGSLPAFSFLPRASSTRVNLWSDFNPRLGRQTHINGLLILHSASAQAQAIITVTAI